MRGSITRLRDSEWLAPAFAAALILGLAPSLRVPDLLAFGSFVIFVALGELLEVRLSSGVTSSLGLAPALAYVFMGHSVAESVFVYAAGAVAASLIGLAWRRRPNAEDVSLRAIVAGTAGALYAALAETAGDPSFGHSRVQISYVGFAVALIVALTLGDLVKALLAGARERIPWSPMFGGSVRATAPLDLSAISAGALLALAYPVLRVWSLPLFLAPLVATHYSFRQLSSIQRTYLQTIRALSKVPEMAGYTRPGHSRRVAELAVEVARELGVSDTSEIEYAALLHDIGRLSLPDPDPVAGGDQVEELALVGANVVNETGHFPDVARMIRKQYDTYRDRGESSNPDVPLGARIIKVASAYDDLTRPGELGRTPWDALERLHLGTAYDYDPAVVSALTKVLEKRGVI